MPQGTTGDVVAVRRGTSRVLFVPETSNLAEVIRAIEVARWMPSHARCIFAGFSPRNTEYIGAVSFEFRLLTPHLSEKEGRLVLDFDQGRSSRHPLTEEMPAQRAMSERVLLRSLCPDAVVIGVTSSQLISARAECVLLVFVRPFAYSLAHLEATHAAGATGFPSRTSPERCLVDNMATRALYALGTRLSLPRSFHFVAKANGVSLFQGVLNGLTADFNLIAIAPHLLPGWLRTPQGHRMVGSVYARLPEELPEFLADLAAGPQPLVYFAMGSLGNRDPILHALAGLGRIDCQVLAPVHSHLHQKNLENFPRNIYITDWLPAHQLSDVVDLAVTCGGEGTVQTSCVQGWFFIGTPLQLEQCFSVQRCAALGSTRLMSQWEARRTDRAELMRQALTDDGMCSRARRMAGFMEGLDGPGWAVEAICELLRVNCGQSPGPVPGRWHRGRRSRPRRC